MVTILPKEKDWGDAFANIGKGFSEGYMERSDENTLKKAIMDLGPNPTPRQIVDAVTGARTFKPESKARVTKDYMGVAEYENSQNLAREKHQSERQAVKGIVSRLDIPEEEKEILSESLSHKAAEDILKTQFKGKNQGEAKLTPFQKKVQEKQADEYVKLTEELPKLQAAKDNLDYMEKLSGELGFDPLGITAPLSGYIGTEKAKELEAVGYTAIEPIVKIFNPSGPIATQKLRDIQAKYKISATDFPWQIKGKISALRRFNKIAMDRTEGRLKLFEEYDGAPPVNAVERYDKESETLSDAMADYDLVGEEKDLPGIPKADSMKGKTITSPDGQKYYSDGLRWVKK